MPPTPTPQLPPEREQPERKKKKAARRRVNNGIEGDSEANLISEVDMNYKFKFIKYKPEDSIETIIKNNEILQGLLGMKRLSTTTPDFPSEDDDDKNHSILARAAGVRLRNMAQFDYVVKTQMYKLQKAANKASSTSKPSTLGQSTSGPSTSNAP